MQARLTRSTSLYIDCLRLVAALIVMLSHVSWNKLSGGFLWPVQPYGHAAVVVFFVLSGFVIAYTAETKDHDLNQFALSRMSRLYSVILPALLLTLIADRIGQAIGPDIYAGESESQPLLRLAAAGLFLSQSWWSDTTLLSNHSYWSMPYEFWYYVIFAAAFYLSGWKRYALSAGAMLIAGPNILLMLPIWLLGVLAYRLSRRVQMPKLPAAGLFTATLLVMALSEYLADGRGLLTRQYSTHYPPGFAAFDYGLAALLAANILASCSLALPFGRWAAVAIKKSAGYSFSIYLYHLPLLYLCAALLPAAWPVPLRGASMLAMTMVAIVALGSVTENRKEELHRLFARIRVPMFRLADGRRAARAAAKSTSS